MVLSNAQAREIDALRMQLRPVLYDIDAWPADDVRYGSLLADCRELVRRLDEKLSPRDRPAGLSGMAGA